jgi:hypothetical protein
MELKYIVFFLTLLIGVPAGTITCLVFPKITRLVIFLMVFCTCIPDKVGINFVSRELYRSATRGFEFNLVDICALILFFVMLLRPKHYKFRWFPPLTVLYGLYMLIGLISWGFAGENLSTPVELNQLFLERFGIPFYPEFEVKLYPLFELSKIARGAFLFLVMVNYIRNDDDIQTLANAFLVTVIFMGCHVLFDRYVMGYHRISATLGHANSLATYMAMMGTVMFGFMLQTQKASRALLFAFGTGFSALSVIMSLSRGGLLALAVGIWLVTTSLLHRYVNLRNVALIFISGLAAVSMLAFAADTLVQRFFVAQDAAADIEYRGMYNAEAKLMAKDNFFGVGLGNFSAWSWEAYAEAVDPELPPGTPAHNIWFLTLGELGILGFVAFVLYWARFYALGIPFLFSRKTAVSYAAGAIAVTATLVGHVQNMLQLGYRQTAIFFLNKMLMALLVACWYIRKEELKREKELKNLAGPKQINL